MRKIKFRGKRVDNGEWVCGYYLVSNEKHYIIDCYGVTSTAIAFADNIASFPGYHEVIPETVGQYTGKHDNNGKEIYEGNILDNEWAVRWWDGHFTLCNPTNEPPESCAKEVFEQLTTKESTITGDIHDNPKLLGEQK